MGPPGFCPASPHVVEGEELVGENVTRGQSGIGAVGPTDKILLMTCSSAAARNGVLWLPHAEMNLFEEMGAVVCSTSSFSSARRCEARTSDLTLKRRLSESGILRH